MSPGDRTPVGQSMAVGPAPAIAAQSQAAQVMTPLPSTTSWPPRRTLSGRSTVPVNRRVGAPPVTAQVAPPGSGGTLAWGPSVTAAGGGGVVAGDDDPPQAAAKSASRATAVVLIGADANTGCGACA